MLPVSGALSPPSFSSNGEENISKCPLHMLTSKRLPPFAPGHWWGEPELPSLSFCLELFESHFSTAELKKKKVKINQGITSSTKFKLAPGGASQLE